MNCSDYRMLIPFRRTGDLLPEDVALLESHLSNCSACASLASPSLADLAVQKAFQNLNVPDGLKQRVGHAVTTERNSILFHRTLRYSLIASIFAVSGLIGFGLYGLTRPKLDTEGLSIVNSYEADSGQLPSLISSWLDSEKIPSDLPFQFDFKYFVSHGYEKLGRAYVPVMKFQNQAAAANGGSFAKIYFVRGSDVDVRGAMGAEYSLCTVRVIPGGNGLTFILVHTGNDSAPFIRFLSPQGI